MYTRLGQPVRDFFQCAAIADPHLAHAAKCDRVTTAQLRQSAAYGLDSHGEIVGDVIPRRGPDLCWWRRAVPTVRDLDQERADFFKRARLRESGNARVEAGAGVERS